MKKSKKRNLLANFLTWFIPAIPVSLYLASWFMSIDGGFLLGYIVVLVRVFGSVFIGMVLVGGLGCLWEWARRNR